LKVTSPVVTFDDVSFAYQDGSDALRGVSFEAPAHIRFDHTTKTYAIYVLNDDGTTPETPVLTGAFNDSALLRASSIRVSERCFPSLTMSTALFRARVRYSSAATVVWGNVMICIRSLNRHLV